MENDTVHLKSEEANLTTSKYAKICDYKTISGDGFGTRSMSMYLYKNITFIESGSRITPLWNVQSDCPLKNENDILYLNDPQPKSVGSDYSGNYRYNYLRFSYSGSINNCKNRNANNDCTEYKYIGSRGGDSDNLGDMDPCDLLGNDTINILREVISWLQIIVPALVIILIGLDITKMVLSGNLDEELPKKKKSIIFRLIIMLIFFFAPLFAKLIIDLLVEAEVNIGDISCLFK